jgi:hypothetical protein
MVEHNQQKEDALRSNRRTPQRSSGSTPIHLHEGRRFHESTEDAMKKEAILGYLVLDQGKPVYSSRLGGFHHWQNQFPISLFLSMKVARRVKRLLRTEYLRTANRFDPQKNEAEKLTHGVWSVRAKGVRIRAVIADNPTASYLKEARRG